MTIFITIIATTVLLSIYSCISCAQGCSQENIFGFGDLGDLH